LKKRPAAIILLLLMSAAFLFIPLSTVLGQLGVNVILVSPQDEGIVGQQVNIQGTIDTTNGPYEIWFDKKLVASKNSEGYYVNANFTIPQVPGGDYNIILRDATENVNATYPFAVTIAHYVEAIEPSPPAQLQEGNSVVLNVTFTGVQSSGTYYANVTVELPEPVSTTFSKTIPLAVSSQTAIASGQVTYPDATFGPEGSHTNYTGIYHVYLNFTQELAENQFFVGFTDKSAYHRGQSVAIHAVGYQPGENASISIEYSKTGASLHSESVTASSEGVISSSWTVPSDALLGDYEITITPDGTAKEVPDSQVFTVPGYPVKVRTLNLAGDLASHIMVEALDHVTNAVSNGSSGDDGVATLNLETGNHTLTAFWNDVQVGRENVTVTGEASFDLTCELTNLRIAIKNQDGNLIPFVSLDITYRYVTRSGATQTGHATGQTGLSGTFILNSVLPGISYTVEASLYGVVFNTGNNTVSTLPVQPLSEVTIICPSRTLTLTVLDYNSVAIPNARIELVEVTSGLFHGATTDATGKVTLEVTFGKYRLRVYTDNNILLNETVVEVFSDTESEIRCSLYNIKVSVAVVDYFKQPISGVNVILHGPGREARSAATQTDGTITFSNVIGGDIQIIAYSDGMEDSYEAVTMLIEEPTTVQIQLAKYVLIGPFLIEASVLATFIIVLMAILLFVMIEVYRRKRAKAVSRESTNG
jgi:hypothetical protein